MRRWFLFVMTTAVLLLILAFLEYRGVIRHNELFAMPYEVKGLDVSHHQGKIDWKTVGDQQAFRFVFMKATEGHDFVDDRFETNWREARKNGLMTGAYHFFSMRSPGEEQAQHFIRTVPKEPDCLPPVIDVEIHLKHDRERVRGELRDLAEVLEKHYGKRPIFYVTYDTYERYIHGSFQEYDLWIRDIVKFPTLGDRPWLFWQYSNRGRVDGVETYVDLNVFRGDGDDLERMAEGK